MKTSIATLAVACAMASTGAAAQTTAFGVNAGTPGVGVQVSAKVSERIVLRGAVDGMSLSRNEDYSDIAYKGDAKLFTGGLFADLHPGGGALFVSGGAYAGQRKLKLQARPTASLDIGGATYTPAQVGRLDGEAKLSALQPFAGVGFDNTFSADHAWGARVLLGVSFSQAPKLRLSAQGGTLSSDPTFLANLRREEADAREDAKDFKYFPIIQVGLTRRF
jgi:hypothetical protein